jgi:hypothetical protein
MKAIMALPPGGIAWRFAHGGQRFVSLPAAACQLVSVLPNRLIA